MNLDFLKDLFKKNSKISSIGLEKALELGLITEIEYHQLKIDRHEKALKILEKK